MATKILNGLDLQSQKIINLADGTSAGDAVTKAQLDAALNGLAWKQPAYVATTTNGTLATAFANGQTVDGISLTTGMRILVKDQTTQTENGVYTVNASGAPTRAGDANASGELQNAALFIVAGTINKDRSYVQTTDDPVIGTSNIVFAQHGGGLTYVAGNGLSLTSSTFAVVPKSGGGLAVDGTGVSIDSAYSGLAKRYSVDVPTNATATITHSLGTTDVSVTVIEVSTKKQVFPEVEMTSTSVVTLTFAVTPTTSQYRVTVIG